jgi:hypothetical protein
MKTLFILVVVLGAGAVLGAQRSKKAFAFGPKPLGLGPVIDYLRTRFGSEPKPALGLFGLGSKLDLGAKAKPGWPVRISVSASSPKSRTDSEKDGPNSKEDSPSSPTSKEEEQQQQQEPEVVVDEGAVVDLPQATELGPKTPTTMAPQPNLEQEKAPTTMAPQPIVEQEKIPTTIAPQPNVEQEKAPTTIASQPNVEQEKIPTTMAPQPNLVQEKAPTTIASQPNVEQEKAPTTIASQPNLEQEKTPATLAIQPNLEQVGGVPTTLAPQPNLEEVKAPTTMAPAVVQPTAAATKAGVCKPADSGSNVDWTGKATCLVDADCISNTKNTLLLLSG